MIRVRYSIEYPKETVGNTVGEAATLPVCRRCFYPPLCASELCRKACAQKVYSLLYKRIHPESLTPFATIVDTFFHTMWVK